MAHSKLDRKRMGKLLGLQSQHSYFALADLLAQRSKKSHSTISTQTLPHSTIHSPSPIKVQFPLNRFLLLHYHL